MEATGQEARSVPGVLRKRLALIILLVALGCCCGSLLLLRGGSDERRQNRSLLNAAPRAGASSAVSNRQVADGIRNVERLLPVARRLSLEAMRELARDYRIRPAELELAERHINAVRVIVLDERLGDMAEVDDDAPEEIRVGAEYAEYLDSDEDAVLLLAHELTHAAASGDNLSEFVEQVAARAERQSGVHPSEDQREDLACDFIGEQALKIYVRQHPSHEPLAARLSRALDYENAGDSEDGGDEEHLSQHETLRALFALDPELGRILHGFQP